MPRSLLITPDLSSGGTARQMLRRAGRSDARVFACFEDFTVGPLIRTSPSDQLLRIRHRFWRKTMRMDQLGLDPRKFGMKDRPSLRSFLPEVDGVEVLLGGAGREQLFLLGLCALLSDLDVEPESVSLYQYPADKPWKSLGIYNVEALAERPEPIRLTRDLLSRFADMWATVCDSSPQGLFRLRASLGDLPEMPYLHRGLDDLISSYPDAKTGLTLADKRLLTSLPMEWTKAARVIGYAMVGVTGDGRSFGDGVLFARLLKMARAEHSRTPVELRGEAESMRSCEVRLTDFGRSCLDGTDNLITGIGIDDWVGGVHLNSKLGSVWYCSGQEVVASTAL